MAILTDSLRPEKASSLNNKTNNCWMNQFIVNKQIGLAIKLLCLIQKMNIIPQFRYLNQ